MGRCDTGGATAAPGGRHAAPGGGRHSLQVSLDVWLFMVPIVEQVHVMPAPPKFVS